MVGFVVVGPADPIKHTRWLMHAYDKNRKVRWMMSKDGLKPHARARPAVVHVTVGGEVRVVGTLAGAGGLARTAVLVLGPKGNATQANYYTFEKGVESFATGYDRLPGGAAILAGYTEKKVSGKLQTAPYIMRLDANGKATKPVLLANNGTCNAVHVKLLPNWEALSRVACPHATKVYSFFELIARIQVDGSKAWELHGAYGSGNPGGFSWYVVGKSVFTATTFLGPVGQHVLRRRVGLGGGQIHWTRKEQGVSVDDAVRVGAKIIEVGDTGKVAKVGRLALRDQHDNRLWGQAVFNSFLGDFRFRAVAVLPDGAIIAAGSRLLQGKYVQAIGLLMSPWGHAYCKHVGKCAGVAWKSCDDGKVCTADRCQAKSGCVHTPAPGFSCYASGPCAKTATCQSTGCVNDKNGALHTASSPSLGAYSSGWQTKPGEFDMVAHNKTGTTGAIINWPTGDKISKLCNTQVIEGSVIGATDAVVLFGRSTSHKATFCRFPRDAKITLKPTWILDVCPKGATCIARGADEEPTGGHYGGYETSDGQGDAAAVRFDASGKVIWDVVVPRPSRPDLVQSVEVSSNGGVFVAGSAQQDKTGWDGLVLRISVNGGVMWEKTIDAGGKEKLLAVTEAVDGGLFGGGYSRAWDVHRNWLVRLDAKGKVLWQHAPPKADQGVWLAVQASAAGLYTLAGSRTVGGKTQVMLRQVSDGGDVVWSREIADDLPLDVTRGGLWPLQPGFLVLGTRGKGKDRRAWFARTDDWGHHDCAVAGACGGKAAKDCDDVNACTADHCVASTGKCQHAPLSGVACGVGKVCKAGACVTP